MGRVKKILGGAAAVSLISLAIFFQALAAGEEEALLTDPVPLRDYEMEIMVISPQEGAEVPEGFVPCSLTIDDRDVPGWVWEDDQIPEYCIFYGMNENGESSYYRYDLTENTLQRYFHDPAGAEEYKEKYIATAMEYNALLHDYEIRFWIIIILTAVIVILLIREVRRGGARNRKTAANGTGPEGESPDPEGGASDSGVSIRLTADSPEQSADGSEAGGAQDGEET